MKNRFKLIKAGAKVGWKIIYYHFRYMIKYSKNPTKYPLEERFSKVQSLMRSVLDALNVKYDIDGLDDFYSCRNKSENSLLICNHVAEIDPVIILAIAKKPISFVAKKEVETLPFVGKIFKTIEGEFLDRSNLRKGMETMNSLTKKLLKKDGLDFVIFPEGTRNRKLNPDLGVFKGGSFKPALNSKVNIQLMSMHGTQRILSGNYWNKFNPIEIKFIKFLKV